MNSDLSQQVADADDLRRFPYSARPPLSASHEAHLIARRATKYREKDAVFAKWAEGYGVIQHADQTQVRIYDLIESLLVEGRISSYGEALRILTAVDRIASAAMWLVVHMAYARNVYPDGREMTAEDFKPVPEGHVGGSLNMAIAYAGYLAANTLSGVTRSWLMGQGHCVAAIDATNLLVGNVTQAHADRYDLKRTGLNRFVRDFYSYSVRSDGQPDSPLGSHVNAHTAGGLMEGGYLGFAELQYVHMPLPGERLVAFLSDGAFEEQRGSDWAPRWWRAEDCGLVAPIMIVNGRRIEQRSGIAQDGGLTWLKQHLRLNGFDPIEIDGRDPAAYVWAIIEMEARLEACAAALKAGQATYPAPLHYTLAEVPKGYGFPGAGTNHAHNLPLGSNAATLADVRNSFNQGARRLWVPFSAIKRAAKLLNIHALQGRPLEKDHPLTARNLIPPVLPDPPWKSPTSATNCSPMDGIDEYFAAIVNANPTLRVRVGNPDELRSNRMGRTLDLLKHRATDPEPGIAEAAGGAVITALNEEAVVSAALANKGGINLAVSYEAFAVKMLGAIRQELIFARHLAEAGRSPGWLSVPIVVTSHTWENGKNEQSHQDPTFCEALLGEMSDASRVLFPADWNSAIAALRATYSQRGQIWTLVVPKRAHPVTLTSAQSQELLDAGAVRVRGNGEAKESVLLTAIGAYQLAEVLRASDRLTARSIAHTVVYMIEPGRFRVPRDTREAEHLAADETLLRLFPVSAHVRVFLTHTRPEPMLGLLRPLDNGVNTTRVLGYLNRGGTLDVAGMLFANRCTWAHALAAVAAALDKNLGDLLTPKEVAAVNGTGDPRSILDQIVQG
jgi:phosphoketolase